MFFSFIHYKTLCLPLPFHDVLTQLAGLRPFLSAIDEATARADDLLQARSDEATKPGGGDFDPEVGTVDFSAGDPRVTGSAETGDDVVTTDADEPAGEPVSSGHRS